MSLLIVLSIIRLRTIFGTIENARYDKKETETLYNNKQFLHIFAIVIFRNPISNQWAPILIFLLMLLFFYCVHFIHTNNNRVKAIVDCQCIDVSCILSLSYMCSSFGIT